MQIGALARKTAVSERLLRYYEEQGLLRPARRPNGYRDYAESDVEAVGHIRTLLAAGLPTAVIGQVLHCVHSDREQLVPSPCPGMIVHLEREHARIDQAIGQLETSRQLLDTILAAASQQPRDDAQDR